MLIFLYLSTSHSRSFFPKPFSLLTSCTHSPIGHILRVHKLLPYSPRLHVPILMQHVWESWLAISRITPDLCWKWTGRVRREGTQASVSWLLSGDYIVFLLFLLLRKAAITQSKLQPPLHVSCITLIFFIILISFQCTVPITFQLQIVDCLL